MRTLPPKLHMKIVRDHKKLFDDLNRIMERYLSSTQIVGIPAEETVNRRNNL